VAEAVSKATNAIAPILSNLSAQFDIPLRVQQMEIVELRTEVRHLIVVVPYNDAPFAPPDHIPLSDDFLLFVSWYREALGSNTAAYQFLCFYKIIEAIRKRRASVLSHKFVAKVIGFP
jgi:LmbE family N-acetylglucosaminyl deacetylase